MFVAGLAMGGAVDGTDRDGSGAVGMWRILVGEANVQISCPMETGEHRATVFGKWEGGEDDDLVRVYVSPQDGTNKYWLQDPQAQGWIKDYPAYWAGIDHKGHFEFRTWVKDRKTLSTLRELRWGMLIDVPNERSKGRHFFYL